MSEATRAVALQHAVATAAGEGVDAVLEAAHKFHAFMVSDTHPTAPATPATPAKPAATPAKPAAKAATKPAKSEEQIVAEAVAKGAAEAEAAADAAPTKEDVGKAIQSMLQANKRAEAVALLKEYNASSASGVPPGSYAEFIDKVQGILLGA